jgi:signal transduction histidine kinase
VERSHRLVKEGLEEVARAVSALRGDRIPGPSQLRELVNEFETDTGVESDFQVAGEARPLSPEAELALYRAAQEALTNVRKHADATRVGVALRYAADGTELRVSDVGTARTAAPNGGYGLVGMRERVELLGGTFDAGPTADGYEVRLWIPA